VVLAVLAWLQYRSSRQISDATTQQMRASLQGALMDFRQGVERELTPLCRAWEADSGGTRSRVLQEYVNRSERWRRVAAHSDLVADVLLWRAVNTQQPQLLRLNSNHNGFEVAAWPPEFARLRHRLLEIGRDLNPPAASLPRPPLFWLIDQDLAALVHPVFEAKGRTDSEGSTRATLTWIVVRIDRQALANHIFPEIVQRYFGVSDQSAYDVAVMAENTDGDVIYSSGAEFRADKNGTPDAALNLFGRPVPILRKTPSAPERVVVPQGPPASESASEHAAQSPSAARDEGPLRIEPIHYRSAEGDWEIVARHRKGSVEAAVTASYHRNLAINFGVLLVLAATMGMIIVASQRARRLAQLQMDFVASVSHELRTPLTGIVSAAQNISDGVVDSKERIARYGHAIMGQARQLTDLVEQILLFSAAQKNRHRYHFKATDVADVIETSMRQSANLIRSSGFIVEREIQPGLPPVMVDFNALSQCLQNLITNAVKYGGVSRWIGIRTRSAERPDGGKEIRITVEDKGIGIADEDLKRIFEPFYRSPAVTAEQIHGSGLGLSLAKTIAEAMGGSLTVESAPQKGSAFTVHLPIKDGFASGEYLSSTPEGTSLS